MTAFSEALARWNFATLERLRHPGNPDVELAALLAQWAWDEFKRGLAAQGSTK